ncbi:hypothetical protein [Bacillus sp. AFS017336]|uniref:helix-turn-helix domain-containing protein n=1 Tax=Bacillus sp. AFS017336 TaxID=2033489 RepID=UPI000BF21719|nr:hypothetical protein [Bacillus sp. AFS017336]PEK99507.1 hypothetical protein CN601_23855 [Bacillus sp. AFS017336]
MIKNDFELGITKENLKQLESSFENCDKDESLNEMSAMKQSIYRKALIGEIENLSNQIKEYEDLKNGDPVQFKLENAIDLPKMIIRSRISKGLSEKELSSKIGMDINEYSDLEDELFADSTPELINQIMDVLNISVEQSLNEILLKSPIQITKILQKRLGELYNKLIPYELVENENIFYGYLKLITSLKRIFSDQFNQILLGNEINYSKMTSARYKVPQNTNTELLYLYTAYSQHISKKISEIIDVPKKKLTTDPKQFREEVIEKYGYLTFDTCANYIWDSGVAILPMDLRGGFHGACWRFEGKNIIVLKQQSKSKSKWLFDLLHEYWHATQEPELLERDVVDINEVLTSGNNDKEEIDANNFANNVIFDGNGESLLEQCIKESKNRIGLLKASVQRVAIKNEVDVSSLANYVAHSVSKKGRNFWGAAQNLQLKENPYLTAKTILESRISFYKVDDLLEKELLENEWVEYN